jgi:hypothetical protein
MINTGPIIVTPKPPKVGARTRAISSLKMNCSPTLMPPPPYSFGQWGAIQPRPASALRHSWTKRARSAFAGGPYSSAITSSWRRC